MKIYSRPSTPEFNENYLFAMNGVRPSSNRCEETKTFATYGGQSKAKYQCTGERDHADGDCKFDVDLHLVPLSELQ